MAGLSEVPTEELLSFQDYPTIHTTHTNSISSEGAQLKVENITSDKNTNLFDDFTNRATEDRMYSEHNEENNSAPMKSFWTLEYYQQFFDVDTRDVMDRIICSFFPRKDAVYKQQMKTRPDLYGPFWIAITLVFTIAISGNIAKYLHHANQQIHWKYDFHLVSYAATAIFLYITLVPLAIWAFLRWSIKTSIDDLEEEKPPGLLELICFYGYSLFIYIPVSILWTIQINFLQWILVGVAACLSGSVLLFALSSNIKISNHKLILSIGIIAVHLLLATGFMLYFFHESPTIVSKPEQLVVKQLNNTTS